MSTHRYIDKICVAVLALTLLLTVAFMNGEKLGVEAVADEDAEYSAGSAFFTANDQDGGWSDNAYTTYVTLDGTGGSVNGSGAYFYDGDLVISNSGWYVLSGSLADGSVVVDADSSAKVWLRLAGVAVSCADDACLRVDQAEKVFLTLAEGTENTFVSGDSYSDDALSDNTGGAIFAHDDLTINGGGSLRVTAGYRHGIDANDELVITGGDITVTAPEDAIHVNDSFRFMAATLTIDAGDDAIHSDGDIYVESGTIRIDRCYEGMEALTIDIAGGDVSIRPTDDGLNANGGTAGFGMGRFGGEQTAQESASDAEETYIRVSGGTLTVVNETGRDADGLDSNGSIYIDGGTILVSLSGDGGNNAIDFGSESGGECVVTGGVIVACGGASMMEGFSDSSTQCAVLYCLDSTAAAETAFRVLDAAGAEVLAYTPPCSYSAVSFSAPALTVGETYTVTVGDAETALAPESTAVTLGNADSTGGMGGMGGMGGGRPAWSSGDGTLPTLPEGESGDGTFPAWDGERPDIPAWDGENATGEGGGRHGFRGRNGEAALDTEAAPSTEVAPDAEAAPDTKAALDTEAAPDAEAAPDSEAAPDTEAASDETVAPDGAPQEGDRPMRGDLAETARSEAAEAAEEQTETVVSAETWYLLAACAAALLLGILFAAFYRKHR